MNFFKKLSDWFDKYCESDEVTDTIFKRDYFYLTYLSGLYANFNKGYRYVSVLNLLVNIGLSLFHLYILGSSCLIVYKYNFTLGTFLFQIFMLLQFSLFVLLSVGAKRKTYRFIVREMMGTEIAYEDEDHSELLGRLKKEDWEEKKRLLVLPVTLCLIGANVLLLAGVIDDNVRYGHGDGDGNQHGLENTLKDRTLHASALVDLDTRIEGPVVKRYGDPGFDREESGLFTMAPLPLGYPWKTSKDSWVRDFVFVSLLQVITAIFMCSLMGSAILSSINIIFAYNLHVKFLIWNVEHVESRAEALLRRYFQKKGLGEGESLTEDPRFQRCIKICLKKVFIHHQKILRWFNGIQDLVGIPMGGAYSTGTIVIALSLLSTKTGTSLPGTALTSSVMCVLEVAIMALLSVLGQRMTDLNEDLRQALYTNSKWYRAHPHIKTDMMIFQEILKRPVELKGYGLIVCNLDTFSNVMNSAYSYYNLIMAF